MGDGRQQSQKSELLGGQIAHDPPQLAGLSKELPQRHLMLLTVVSQYPYPRAHGQVETERT